MNDNPFDVGYIEPQHDEPEADVFGLPPIPNKTAEKVAPKGKGVVMHADLIQGSEEWAQQRCGLLTASEMKLIITPTLKIASNDKERTHLYELLAQRVTRYVEPHYISDDMVRGHDDEIEARIQYEKKYPENGPVTNIGFITNDEWGFTIGYSPDGLVGDRGLLEAKSRRQKYQVQTIIENVIGDTIPADFMLQCQTGPLVSKRDWVDFISYSGGLPMATVRVWPDPVIQNAIIEAAGAFEARLAAAMAKFNDALASRARLIPTERRVEQEMYI